MRTFAMKQAQLLGQFREIHGQQHMETVFLYFAAPVMQGVKPASLMSLQPDCLSVWRERQNALRAATGLRTREIINQGGAVLLLLYDEAAMAALLGNPQTMELLNQYGYPTERGMEEMLTHLQFRFTDAGFPHEIGIFLGYPMEDVRGFIANGGKNCVCSRYWKVYHDEERARKLFQRIDDAHSYAMDLLCRPMPFHVAANLLKAM